jgi:predicted DNA-binding transcriptional regulator AlpA
MSLTDIAELLGMTRAGTDKLVKREATFPPPVAVLTGRTRVWKREDVERWARETGRA